MDKEKKIYQNSIVFFHIFRLLPLWVICVHLTLSLTSSPLSLQSSSSFPPALQLHIQHPLPSISTIPPPPVISSEVIISNLSHPGLLQLLSFSQCSFLQTISLPCCKPSLLLPLLSFCHKSPTFCSVHCFVWMSPSI